MIPTMAYSYILHSSGKKYLNTQPGRRTPKSSIIFSTVADNYLTFFWHSIWHIFWHSIWHIFWHIFWHSFWHIFWHSVWHIFWHSFRHSVWHSVWHIFWHSSRWGPAVPTAIWKSRLRSGSAHWDLELAVEVRQCTLGSGARGGAVPTGIWTARRRRRVRRRRRRTALIKPNNPHLAGGEKFNLQSLNCNLRVVYVHIFNSKAPPRETWEMWEMLCLVVFLLSGVNVWGIMSNVSGVGTDMVKPWSKSNA